MENTMNRLINKGRQLADLKSAAEAFRVAMIESGAVNHVRQDLYFTQLRRLERSLADLNYLVLDEPNEPCSAVEMRERCAEFHDGLEVRFQQNLKETLALPGHERSCPGLAEGHSKMADLHKGYAAEVRALPLTKEW